MNLPNMMTLSRVLLIPLFVIFVINKRLEWALVTFAVAGITDGIDGLMARITGQRTELGSYLDPIADKLLVSSAFITLAIIEIIPSWLAVIVITRDVIILIGILVMVLLNQRPKIKPSLLSKATTFLQISTVIIVLLSIDHLFFKHLITVIIYGTALFTILSGSHYIYVGTRLFNKKENSKR